MSSKNHGAGPRPGQQRMVTGRCQPPARAPREDIAVPRRGGAALRLGGRLLAAGALGSVLAGVAVNTAPPDGVDPDGGISGPLRLTADVTPPQPAKLPSLTQLPQVPSWVGAPTYFTVSGALTAPNGVGGFGALSTDLTGQGPNYATIGLLYGRAAFVSAGITGSPTTSVGFIGMASYGPDNVIGKLAYTANGWVATGVYTGDAPTFKGVPADLPSWIAKNGTGELGLTTGAGVSVPLNDPSATTVTGLSMAYLVGTPTLAGGVFATFPLPKAASGNETFSDIVKAAGCEGDGCSSTRSTGLVPEAIFMGFDPFNGKAMFTRFGTTVDWDTVPFMVPMDPREWPAPAPLGAPEQTTFINMGDGLYVQAAPSPAPAPWPPADAQPIPYIPGSTSAITPPGVWPSDNWATLWPGRTGPASSVTLPGTFPLSGTGPESPWTPAAVPAVPATVPPATPATPATPAVPTTPETPTTPAAPETPATPAPPTASPQRSGELTAPNGTTPDTAALQLAATEGDATGAPGTTNGPGTTTIAGSTDTTNDGGTFTVAGIPSDPSAIYDPGPGSADV